MTHRLHATLLCCLASLAFAQKTQQPPTPSTITAAGAVLGNANLSTVNSVPYVSAAGTLNQAGYVYTAVPAWRKYAVAKVANGTTGCSSFDVAAPVYTPIGPPALNDAASGGTYSASGTHTYTAEIDLADATDTFRWRKDAGAWTNGVAMTGAAQTLADGVTITWTATTGHTLGDSWAITATDLGCFQVNSGTPVAAEGDLSQDLVLFQLPANGFVDAVRIKTSTAFTGAATAAATLGTATDTSFYVAAGYDLAAVVGPTNFVPATGVPVNAGSTTAAAVNVVLNITTTVNNLTALATGSAVDVWVKFAVLP